MNDYDDKLQAYYNYLARTNVIGGKVTCPLCTDEHEVCTFTSGSLDCIRSPCRNPHHREEVR